VNVYLDLTRELNEGRLRAVICSGQAVVLHRLAILSKDGDWILREDQEALDHVLAVLEARRARYRFGAPLDLRWMSGGWSSHFEFRQDSLRVRTDFFARPPRISADDLVKMWEEMEEREIPFVGAKLLAEMKKTNREKDYAVIGELARIMPDPGEQLLYSRSALDLIELHRQHPELARRLASGRPLLVHFDEGRQRLEEALDAERRALIHANERRLQAYLDASRDWYEAWPEMARQAEFLPLREAHALLCERASGLLPERVSWSAE